MCVCCNTLSKCTVVDMVAFLHVLANCISIIFYVSGERI